MNANDLFERRADRGRHRGAAEVWADAHHDVHADQATSAAPDRSPRWWSVASFRVAFAVISVAALAALTIPFDAFDTETDSVAAPAVEDEAQEVAVEDIEPPAQLLIEGMTLDSAFDPTTVPAMDVPAPANEVGRTWVFTHPTDPFDHPVAIGTVTDTGRSLAVINRTVAVDDDPIAVFIDGEWQAAIGTGYVLAVDFERPGIVDAGSWQFDFRDGADGATWQAIDHAGGEEWRWILRGLDNSTTLQPIKVLDHDGVELVDADGNSQVIWSVDDYVFRLSGSRVEEDISVAAESTSIADLLYEADDAEWDLALADASDASSVRTGTIEIPLAYLATGLGVLIAAGFLGWFVYNERSSAQKSGDD